MSTLHPLDDLPGDDLVLRATAEGAAMLEGWGDGERWRWLLPWPDDTRSLSWDRSADWQTLFASLEEGLPIEDPASIEGREVPFLGGWVGFVSYEATASEEAILPRSEHPPEPAMFFALHRAGIVIDPRGRAYLFAPEGEAERYRELVRAYSARRDDSSSARSSSPHPAFGHLLPASGEKGNKWSVLRNSCLLPLAPRQRGEGGRRPGEGRANRAETISLHDSLGNGVYAQAIARIREAIRDGDVYQVNLTRALTAGGPHDAGTLYRALTGSEPPRSSAFIRGHEWAIASASPEVLLRFDRRDEVAETRPIKGTVRREGDDAAEIATLLASEKDAAEHLMIVDVSRNDLGKVAQVGSVEVAEFRAVRTLAHVHHLESVVRARTTGCSASTVLAALAPAASITGAPKRAAVGVIRELEPVARGVYCGTIGFIGTSRVELSVAIRTAVITDDGARYHAGGGIVWDSDAAAEDEESFAKAAAFLDYLGASR